MAKDILIRDEIKLDQFLKWSRVTSTGGQSKLLIASDMVRVNGRLENRRSRKLKHGDLVEVENMGSFRVVTEQECS
ncbi:RNA-binding S4 domain-containing protein [Desulfoscipio geothermicus]|uniref:Ribosome-associated protein n=1 Tax=Desulfoscipio geothermicus DSM 3669 TaxID=1121426 RepID=A0A1I6E2C8_9FIRM|nr:RNA-binding S4 domain-containing protein [Desulfoscipio geothermicus]SFR11910.1 ribosome-associated protein [Desulfoscipio geothermicus DSM 3669]